MFYTKRSPLLRHALSCFEHMYHGKVIELKYLSKIKLLSVVLKSPRYKWKSRVKINNFVMLYVDHYNTRNSIIILDAPNAFTLH